MKKDNENGMKKQVSDVREEKIFSKMKLRDNVYIPSYIFYTQTNMNERKEK